MLGARAPRQLRNTCAKVRSRGRWHARSSENPPPSFRRRLCGVLNRLFKNPKVFLNTISSSKTKFYGARAWHRPWPTQSCWCAWRSFLRFFDFNLDYFSMLCCIFFRSCVSNQFFSKFNQFFEVWGGFREGLGDDFWMFFCAYIEKRDFVKINVSPRREHENQGFELSKKYKKSMKKLSKF